MLNLKDYYYINIIMQVDYNTFISNIEQLNAEQYLNSHHHINNEKFNQFYDNYLVLYEEEKKKYNANAIKFKKSIMEQKNMKYLKIHRDDKEFKKIYDVNTIQNENEKILIIIRSHLNKICEETYEKVSKQLIEELINHENIKIFELLSQEIINKCIFDNKYRNLYIQLCNQIWSNRELHYNLITIKKKNYDYYWYLNNDNNCKNNENAKDSSDGLNESNIEYHGPFKNESTLKNDAFKKMNFKFYFLNYIQNLFNQKNLNITQLGDELFFEEKKKLLSLCELISILFIDKHINFKIINIVIINLLHLNNNFETIIEIEFELINLILTKIKEQCTHFKFEDYTELIQQYVKILTNYLETDISKRSKFFIEEIIILFRKLVQPVINNSYFTDIYNDNHTNSHKSHISSNPSAYKPGSFQNEWNNVSTLSNKKLKSKDVPKENIIETSLDYIKKQNNNQLILFLESLGKEDKTICIQKMISLNIDKSKKYNLFFIQEILHTLNNEYSDKYFAIIYQCLKDNIQNITDIILDVPDIGEIIKNIISIIQFTKQDENTLNSLIDTLSIQESDNEEDSDSEW